MIIIFVVGPVASKDLIHRLNYGTVFQEQPLLFATSEYWVHTFVLDLNPPNVPLFQRPTCPCPTVQSVFDRLHKYHNETMNAIHMVTSNMLSMIKTSRKQSKSKRSLLPFLGNIAKSLIGVSTTEDLDRVAEKVAYLHRENTKPAKSFQHELSLMTSFMKTANNRLDNAFKSININHETIEQIAQNVTDTVASAAAAAEQELILIISLEQFKNYLQLQNEYQQLFTAFKFLLQGKLSPIIIPQTELIKTIGHIHNTLFLHRPGFNLLHNSPTYFYEHAEFKLHISNGSILILVKFPLGSRNQPMKLFKILNYPIPVTNTSSHATQIDNLSTYLAISHLRDSYSVLPDSALNECTFDMSSVNCHFSVPLQSMAKPNCALALFHGNKLAIHTYATFV